MIGCHRDFSQRLFVWFSTDDTVTALAATVSLSRAPEKEPAFLGALRQSRFAERTASSGRVRESNAHWLRLSEVHAVSRSICCRFVVWQVRCGLVGCCRFVSRLLYICCWFVVYLLCGQFVVDLLPVCCIFVVDLFLVCCRFVFYVSCGKFVVDFAFVRCAFVASLL